MSDSPQVLIVDDSEETVLFLTEILEEHGYGFQVANDGREALAAMRENPPDLVLLDIMMPRKTGLGVLKDMKKDPQLEQIPVIVVSGASDATGVDIKTGEARPLDSYDDDFARSYGAKLHEVAEGLPEPDGYIEKPIDPPALVAKIKAILS